MAGANSTACVKLRIGAAILRDFARRRMFPKLRPGRALAVHADGGAVFAVGRAEAAALLADAAAELPNCTSGALAGAYAAHQARCWAAVSQLQEIALALNSPQPVLLGEHDGVAEYAGTRRTLRELGVVQHGPWPGDPGGNIQRMMVWRDQHRAAEVAPLSSLTRGAFRVVILRGDLLRRARQHANDAEIRDAAA